ncbi:hypothetical protein [Caldisericum sp.]|jgi:hypothetical protein|uniref:hypothetical protein n=1 Tax=Caldisericum sp. TaxID=2499687 RepID=UPI003CAD2784
MKKIIDEIKKEYGSVEIKRIGHNYYVYRVSSIYDREKKRAKKISGEYIGRITMNGLEKRSHCHHQGPFLNMAMQGFPS